CALYSVPIGTEPGLIKTEADAVFESVDESCFRDTSLLSLISNVTTDEVPTAKSLTVSPVAFISDTGKETLGRLSVEPKSLNSRLIAPLPHSSYQTAT